jgi:hypothetical protein
MRGPEAFERVPDDMSVPSPDVVGVAWFALQVSQKAIGALRESGVEPAYAVGDSERVAATQSNVTADSNCFARLIAPTKRVSKRFTPAGVDLAYPDGLICAL